VLLWLFAFGHRDLSPLLPSFFAGPSYTGNNMTLVLGTYGAAWVAAILMRVIGKQRSLHSLAKGMMWGLLVSGGLGLCGFVGLSFLLEYGGH
jgi:hypothetical protein